MNQKLTEYNNIDIKVQNSPTTGIRKMSYEEKVHLLCAQFQPGLNRKLVTKSLKSPKRYDQIPTIHG